MSRINKKTLISILEKASRGSCPVLPMQKLEEFTNGKLVGMAMGTGILLKMFVEEEIITEGEYDRLNSVLSNRDIEDVLRERQDAKDLEEEMRKLEEGLEDPTTGE